MLVRLSNVLAAVALPAACVVLAGCGQASVSGSDRVFSIEGARDGKTIAPAGGVVSCQWTGPRYDDIQIGCGQVLDSLQLR